MLKMVSGDPPNILILGLSFHNIDTLIANPNDVYIPIKRAEVGIPMDVILCSGKYGLFKARDRVTGREVFIISFSNDQLIRLRRNPGRHRIDVKKEKYDIPFSILIFSGETEASMTDLVSEFIGPTTSITMDDKLKN